MCWKCRKEGHYKRDCKSKDPDKGKGSDDAPSTKVKTTLDEGGDVYLASSSTHVDHEAWLIHSGASFTSLPIESGSVSMRNMMVVMSSWGMIGRLESLVVER